MSSLCPLCGKNKSEEALFCDECEKKIRNEYEVKMPGQLNFAENASTGCRKWCCFRGRGSYFR